MLTSEDIVPITRARARLTELADDVAKNGGGKILTRNGESYVAIIPAADYDKFRQWELEDDLHTLRMIADGLEDVEAGRVMTEADLGSRLAALRERVVNSMSQSAA